jgi:hypothetical protein
MVLITFNSVENLPITKGTPRPEFLVSRDCRSIMPVADDAMLSFAATNSRQMQHQ